MKALLRKQFQQKQRAHRVRARVIGTAERPRLAVSRSLNHIRAQIIDDSKGRTLASASDLKTKAAKGTEGGKVGRARQVGTELAKLAQKAGIKAVVFDRGSRRYHGRVKAVADAAREGGLQF